MNLLEELIKAGVNTQLMGPLDRLPTPIKAVLGATPAVAAPGMVNKAQQQAKLLATAAMLTSDRAAGTGVGNFVGTHSPPLAIADRFGMDEAAVALARAFQQRAATASPVERALAANKAAEDQYPVQMGVANEAANLANYLPVARLAASARGAGRLAQLMGDLDRAQGAPIELAAKGAGRALRPVLNLLAEQRAAREGAGAAATGLPAPPLDLDALLQERRAGNPLPLAPTIGEFGRYAKREGLPTRPSLPREASPLAPDNFSILRAAKALQGQAPPRAPEVIDALDQGTQTTPPATLPARDGGTSAVELPQVPTVDRLRAFLRGEEARVGTIYLPNDPAFYRDKGGIDPAELPDALDALLADGTIGRQSDGGLALRPTTPAPRATSAALRGVPELPDVDPTVVPDDALSMADEAAAIEANQGVRQLLPRPEATDLPAVGSAASLAPDEIDGLLSIAYPTETAIGHAIAKYPDPTDLANRAIERITTTPNLTRELGERYPEVARRIALLDLPGESAMANDLPDLGDRAAWQADYLSKSRAGTDVPPSGEVDQAALNALSPQDRMAALRKLAGGDLAAGGGDDKLLAPLAPFGRTAAGAALGGATGALAGALADEEDRGRGALTGAGIGAAAGANLGGVSPEIAAEARKIGPAIASRFRDTALDPGIWEEAVARGIQDQIDAGANKGVRGGKAAWDAFWRQQRSQVVNTLKQIPQDAFTQLITRMGIAGREFGIDDSDIRRMAGVLRRERQVGGASSLTNPNPVNARLLALGNKNAVSKSQEYFGLDYGTSLAGEGAEFKGGGRAAAGALIGALNGAARLNPLAMAYGAARGYVAPFVDGTIRYVNGIQHDAFRYAMVEKGLDREIPQVAAAFLDDLDTSGVDTTALRAGGGYFSADEVRRVAGDDAAKRWDWLQETTVRRIGDRVAFLAGDFRDKLAKDYGGRVTRFDRARAHVEAGIGRYVPFVRWQMRYAPVLAEIAARNPLATYYAVKGTAAGVEDARENHLKPYQAGTVPVTTETPVLGGLARARLGGQAGTVRLDPLGAINPYGSGSFVADELPADATGYQRATNAAARIGFSPAPPIQAAAYAAGQDYKAPSALSRTAGLEGLADLPPILARAILQGMGQHQLAAAVPELPTLPGGGEALARAREIVTGQNATAYDPTTRRYAELVLARTGKPLAHPDNRAYLEAVGEANEPLWQLATVQQRLGGAAGNATGMISPVSVTAQTREAVGAQAAGKLPFTIGQIIDAPTEPIRKQMEAANAAAIKADPRLGTYQQISGGGRERALIEQWEREHQGLKRIAPALYAERLKAYKASIR